MGDLIKEIVLLSFSGKIPDEQTALQLAPSAMAGLMPGQPTWPSNVISQVNMFNVFTSFAVVHLIFIKFITVNICQHLNKARYGYKII